ncbi:MULTISPECIES: SusC/RagA family TonB-linked outer membrane protein [Butyricimonas]|uniref:SusC/RagA family TonB-linked outer membrane protein n=1 Tax=Butyricimonas TaxID=574697 RepID=UPI001D06DE3E|nr:MULTISPECIES: SusC/RagA family TonB-linked outer membrane protein [Butyricimonas]MCB6974742.1 SusC/RagA family TonB-linked outer membrane protein [Butyricimonas synergistica]MCG4521484.1 SusC/RagA family TonB-linked outer membrane protein [Butyricimonas sp. DFI.6.44]
MKKNGYTCKKGVIKFPLAFVHRFLYLLLGFVFLSSVPGNAQAQEKRFDLKMQNVSLDRVIEKLREVSNLTFAYQLDDVKAYTKVSFDVKQKTVGEILDECLKKTELSWKQVDETIIIYKRQVHKELRATVIKGEVLDVNKAPIPGATVKLVGTTVGVATDSEGKYTISLPVEKGTLEYSCIGYKTKQVAFSGAKDMLRVSLEEDVEALEEVVITGYQVIKKKMSTGATSDVDMGDLALDGTRTLESALQGKVPGMMVINRSGLTGTRQRVRVRGTSTLLGNAEPVWVVDGIIQEDPLPFKTNDFNNLDPSNTDMINDFVGGAISWLNPKDIESITVLKDAIATAIYGTKAANGVIVITTKKGKVGRMSVSYSGGMSYSPRMTYKKLELMNSQQRVDVSREAYETNIPLSGSQDIGYTGLAKAYRNREITLEEFTAGAKQLEMNNTDWFKVFFRDAISHNHTVSISGGSEAGTYYASFGINDSNNTAKGNGQTQYTGNLSISARLWEKITLSTSLAGSVAETKAFVGTVNPYTYASTTNRAIARFTPEGKPFFYAHKENGYLYNLENELKNSGNENTTSSLNGSLSLRWQILESLSFTTTAAYSFSNVNGETYYTEQSNYIAAKRMYNFDEFRPGDREYENSLLPHGGELTQSSSRSVGYTWRNQLDFVKVFNGKHSVSAALGYEVRSSRGRGSSETVYGYMPDRGKVIVNIPAYSGDPSWGNVNDMHRTTPSISDSQTNTMSYYLTLGYMFDDRYAFNMSVRSDGSNRFGQDKSARFQPVWALGFRWNMEMEPWMQNQNIVRGLNFNFSYGYQGNVVNNVSPFLIATIGKDPYSYDYTLNVKDLPAPDLKWEKTQSINYAISGSLFDNKISFSYNGYYKKTTDMVIAMDVPYENGVPSRPINGGKMENSGWDASFGFTPVKGKNFIVSTSFNMGKVHNKVKSEIEPKGSWQEAAGGNLPKEGYPVSSFWAFRFTGLNSEHGGPMFDLTGSELEEAKRDATLYMEYAGKMEPDFNCGMSFSIRYKTLSLSSGLYLSVGNQTYLAPMGKMSQSIPSEYENMSTEWVKRWRKPGDEKITNVPSLPNKISSARTIKVVGEQTNPYDMYAKSTVRVVDAWYLRCGNISLSYSLPERLLPGSLQNLGFSFSFGNPFQLRSKDFKGRDPEVALGGQPLSRTMSLGVSVSF